MLCTYTSNPPLTHAILSWLIQMYQQPCGGPSASSVFPLESAGAAFPFCEQADLFHSFGSGGSGSGMEDQCSLSLLLDTALPHAASPQFAFQKQVEMFARGISNLYS
jgi:hypothetical protein